VQNGVVLRSIGVDGSFESDMTFIPGVEAQLSIGSSGRVAVLSREPGIPISSGAFGNPAEHKISVVAFQQRNAHEAPALGAYDAILEAEVQRIQSITKYARVRTTLSSSAVEPMGFTAGIISGNSERSTGFEIVNIGPTIPAEVTVEARDNYQYGAGLFVLVPGAQGTIYLPLRGRLSELSLTSFFDRSLSVPGPSASLIEAKLTVRFFNGKSDPELPFRIRSTESWLVLAQGEATTPATITASIDPRGMAAGTSRTVGIICDFGSFQREFRFSLTVGPRIQLEPRPPQYFVSKSQEFRHTLTLSSDGEALAFRIQDVPGWMKISPMSGTTPQVLEFTVDTKSLQASSYSTATFGVSGANFSFVFQKVYFALPEQEQIPFPGSVPREQAPGALLMFSGGPARCDAVALQPLPWPESLGGCSVSVTGRRVPIGMSSEVQSTPSIRGSFLPTYTLTVQIPADLPLGGTKLEVEGKDGRTTSYDLFLVEFAPKIVSISGEVFPSFSRRSGETIRLSVSGIGARPTFRLIGNVGGRVAKVVSFQPSPELQGVHDLELEIPPLLPGTYSLSLQVGEAHLLAGQVNVLN
jgi:hypothetical protein